MTYSYDRTAKTDPLSMILTATRDALGHVNEAIRLQQEAQEELKLNRIMSFVLMGIRGVDDQQAVSKLTQLWNGANRSMASGHASDARKTLDAIQQAVNKIIADNKTQQVWDDHYRQVEHRRNTR